MVEEDGILEYVGNIVGEAAQAARTWLVTDEIVRKAMMEADGLKDAIESMQIARSYVYNTSFVYLTSADDEYLIPFSYYADEINLENGKVYTVSEIAKIFNKHFDEQRLLDSSGYGGVPFRQQQLIPPKTAVAVISVSIAGIIIWVFLQKIVFKFLVLNCKIPFKCTSQQKLDTNFKFFDNKN